MAKGKASDWIAKTCDRVEHHAKRVGQTELVCASGISPSGEIHLGNVREIITVHLVAEELKARGHQARHIHSWDDYDRFRKVPASLPESYAKYIGFPLSEIPDVTGEYGSYAERHMTEFGQHMEALGIRPEYIRQSAAYKAGTYTDAVKLAMDKRHEIFDILAEQQTESRQERPREERRKTYYPFTVYCESCQRDTTEIREYDAATATISYGCKQCEHAASFSLNDRMCGKLVWKVDWPMRWNHEKVIFEPGGDDHASPGSSYTVGKDIVKLFGWQAPYFVGYAFVGVGGASKMSSSAGNTATPRVALEILEPAMLRWLYIRKQPRQRFDIDFGQEMIRLYEEWDRFSTKATKPEAADKDKALYARCTTTSIGELKTSSTPVSFRLLSSSADIAQGSKPQVLRIVRDHNGDERSDEELELALNPRLDCAIFWALNVRAEEERTVIRDEFAADKWAELDETNRGSVQLLIEKMEDVWTLKGLTSLVYGIPKLSVGAAMDAPPTDEIKKAQRAFFVSLYTLLCSSDTGPRLPTLLLSVGAEKVRQLLTAP